MQAGVLIAEHHTLNRQTRRMAAVGFGFSWSLQPSLGHTFHLCSDVSGWGLGLLTTSLRAEETLRHSRRQQ